MGSTLAPWAPRDTIADHLAEDRVAAAAQPLADLFDREPLRFIHIDKQPFGELETRRVIHGPRDQLQAATPYSKVNGLPGNTEMVSDPLYVPFPFDIEVAKFFKRYFRHMP